MQSTAKKIETALELPFSLIDLHVQNERFQFQFLQFHEEQTEESIRMGGVTGEFGIVYEGAGMHCAFRCDITVGNVYDFYLALNDAYQALDGRTAVLKNYGDLLNRTRLAVRFDRHGHCTLEGMIQNKENHYRSGVIVSLQTDQTGLSASLRAMRTFFGELQRIQGHSNFY